MLVILGMVLLNTSCQGGGPTVLEFVISLHKTQFRAGEEIPLTMVLQNLSSENIVVNQRLVINDPDAPSAFREVYFRIETPSGEEALFRWDLRIGFPGRGDFSRLAPGRSIEETVDIAALYSLDQEGEYQITAIYENTLRGPMVFDEAAGEFVELDIDAVIVKIESNTLTFQIN